METYFPSSMWIESRIPIQLHLHLYYCCRCLLRLRHDFQSIFIFACINKNETCHSHRPKKSSYLLFTPFTFADMLVVGSFNIEGFFNFIPLYRTNIDLFSTFYFSRHLTRAIGYAKRKHACIEWNWDIFPSEYVCDAKKNNFIWFQIDMACFECSLFSPHFLWHSEPIFDEKPKRVALMKFQREWKHQKQIFLGKIWISRSIANRSRSKNTLSSKIKTMGWNIYVSGKNRYEMSIYDSFILVYSLRLSAFDNYCSN